MTGATCSHCHRAWPVLEDGTLAEHPQPQADYFLCSGSRTRPAPATAPYDRGLSVAGQKVEERHRLAPFRN